MNLDVLWQRYANDVPYARKFVEISGGAFDNDHVAFHSLRMKNIVKVFEDHGWRHGGDYEFPDVHLRAVHLSKANQPRIFVSEIDASKFPVDVQRALARIKEDPPYGDEQWFHEPQPPQRADVELVESASQYGAWLLCFGRRVNHFTAGVDDVEKWQRVMKENGVPMKDEIEGAPGSNLRQTATHAANVDVLFADGSVKKMPYAYFEIAERHNGFDGFLGPQARQLFDMTKR